MTLITICGTLGGNPEVTEYQTKGNTPSALVAKLRIEGVSSRICLKQRLSPYRDSEAFACSHLTRDDSPGQRAGDTRDTGAQA